MWTDDLAAVRAMAGVFVACQGIASREWPEACPKLCAMYDEACARLRAAQPLPESEVHASLMRLILADADVIAFPRDRLFQLVCTVVGRRPGADSALQTHAVDADAFCARAHVLYAAGAHYLWAAQGALRRACPAARVVFDARSKDCVLWFERQ